MGAKDFKNNDHIWKRQNAKQQIMTGIKKVNPTHVFRLGLRAWTYQSVSQCYFDLKGYLSHIW